MNSGHSSLVFLASLVFKFKGLSVLLLMSFTQRGYCLISAAKVSVVDAALVVPVVAAAAVVVAVAVCR